MTVSCWRPYGSIRDEIQRFFLGSSPQLVDRNILFGRAWEARSSLTTVSSGKVRY